MKFEKLSVIIDKIIENDRHANKDRPIIKPSASDVYEWEMSAAGIDTCDVFQ